MSVKKTTLFFFIILCVASFLRLYRFETHLEFLDDQGRDALIMKRILIDHDLTLLGPGTSVGKMYLGPLYYYVMVPFLAMTYPEPTGPAYAIAVMGILTVVLVYVIGKRMIGEGPALIASALYAISPQTIQLSRFSWQPNPAPLVALVMMWCMYRALHTKNVWWWVGVAGCFAILSHLHYVALLSALPSGILLIYDMMRSWKKKGMVWSWIGVWIISALIMIVSILPLVAFDLRHDHLILKGFQEFLQDQRRPVAWTTRAWHALTDTHGRSMFVTAELYGLSKKWRLLNTGVTLFVVAAAIYFAKKKTSSLGVRIVVLWLVASIIGLSIYPDTIHSHYVAFLFPASFFVLGIVAHRIWNVSCYMRYILGGIGVALLAWNLSSLPFWKDNAGGYRAMRRIANEVAREVQQDGSYNIALLNTNREYRGMKYRYFFSTTPHIPQSEYNYEKLDTLVVFVENGENPVKSPIYEIQQFLREHPRYAQMTVKSYPGIVDAYIFRK